MSFYFSNFSMLGDTANNDGSQSARPTKRNRVTGTEQQSSEVRREASTEPPDLKGGLSLSETPPAVSEDIVQDSYFPFLQLPAEIRNMIYQYAIDPKPSTRPVCKVQHIGPRFHSVEVYSAFVMNLTYDNMASLPGNALVSTCKIIRAESLRYCDVILSRCEMDLSKLTYEEVNEFTNKPTNTTRQYFRNFAVSFEYLERIVAHNYLETGQTVWQLPTWCSQISECDLKRFTTIFHVKSIAIDWTVNLVQWCRLTTNSKIAEEFEMRLFFSKSCYKANKKKAMAGHLLQLLEDSTHSLESGKVMVSIVRSSVKTLPIDSSLPTF